MKAVVCTKYGPPEVLQLRDMPKPSPKEDEVLIRVRAAAVTASDIFVRSLEVPLQFRLAMRLAIGLTKPRGIVGIVLAGEVESAGSKVKRFRAGDRVYGVTGLGLGTYAEYKCMRETDSMHGCLARMPSTISFEEATVAAYGGLLALQALERGDIRHGKRALIYGASGTCGTTAVQVAKHWGAEVTGVCGSAHVELVKSLGADFVLDYTKQHALDESSRFDLVVDAVGRAKTSKLKEACKVALTPSGRYVSIDDGNLKLVSRRLETLAELIDAGHMRPVLDRSYPLSEIVEAHRYVGKGHKSGGVAITV